MTRYTFSALRCLFAAILCLCSCERALVEKTDDLIEYSIIASCTESRTANNGMSTVWTDDDALTVFYPNSGKLASARFDYSGDNSFTGRIQHPDTGGDWYALYPFSEAITSAQSAGITMPASLTQNGNSTMTHLAGEGFPLVGTADGVDDGAPSILLSQVAAVARFVVTNAETFPIIVTGIEFTAPVAIAGKFTADLTAAELAWSPVAGQSGNTVTLSVSDGAELAPGAAASFYMGLMPFDQTGEFTVKFTATGNGKPLECIKQLEYRHIALSAGTVTRLNINFKDNKPAPFVKQYELVTEAPENWDGEYLILNSAVNGTAKAWNALDTNGSTVDVTVKDGAVLWTESIEKYDLSFRYFDRKYPDDNTTKVYTLQNSDGNHVFASQSAMHVNSTNVNGSYTCGHVFKLYSDGALIRCAQMETTSSYYYLNYGSSKYQYTKVSSIPAYRLFLFKLAEGPRKESQTLSFPENSISWNVGNDGDYNVGFVYSLPQTVSGALTDVTYTSSDQSVASLVGNNTIMINGVGKTTITATAEENDYYSAATASYTLTVYNGNVTVNRNLGNFDLLNVYADRYLQAAEKVYTDSNWPYLTIMGDYPHSGGRDRPNPVVIPIEGYENSTATVSVFNDAGMADLENTLTTTVSNSKIDFYNLIPGRTYYYTVTVSGEEVDSGTFTTTGRRRYLKVSDLASEDHANNLRDLGGMRTGNGTLKFGKIFRGTNMDKTTADEQQIITGYMNVRRDIDLRLAKSGETESTHSTRNAWRPLDEDLVAYTNYGWDDFSKLTDDMIKGIFTDIISTVTSGEGAVYFHCYIGADRTGYVALMLEAVLGVSEKDTSIDYELTSFSCAGRRYRDRSQDNWHYFEGLEKIEGYRGDTFQEKATNILLDVGITQDQINALRAAMIE